MGSEVNCNGKTVAADIDKKNYEQNAGGGKNMLRFRLYLQKRVQGGRYKEEL